MDILHWKDGVSFIVSVVLRIVNDWRDLDIRWRSRANAQVGKDISLGLFARWFHRTDRSRRVPMTFSSVLFLTAGLLFAAPVHQDDDLVRLQGTWLTVSL